MPAHFLLGINSILPRDISYENLSFQELAEVKMNHGRKVVKAMDEFDTLKKTAKKFKENGVSVEIIMDSTGLSREDIEAL